MRMMKDIILRSIGIFLAGFFVSASASPDSDGDGIGDNLDNCIQVPNADQRNSNAAVDLYGNRCDADLNDDGFVNIADLAAFKSVFGTADADADLDGSGFVNIADLAIFKSLFGKPPGPSGLIPPAVVAGNWEVNSLATGPGAPWWQRGSGVINDDGTWSFGSLQNSDGTTDSASGTFKFSSDGTVAAVNGGDITEFGSLDLDKTVLIHVDEWTTGAPGTSELSIMTRMADAYAPADLEGSWSVHVLASGDGAPWWYRGTYTIGADGSSAGDWIDSAGNGGIANPVFTLAPDGIVTMSGTSTFRGVMDVGKTLVIGTSTWETGSPGTTDISIATRIADSYSSSDVVGTWKMFEVASGPGAPWWERATLTIDADGFFTMVGVDAKGDFKVSQGVINISADGIASPSADEPAPVCSLDAGKTVLVCTHTWDNGTTELRLAAKVSDSVQDIYIPPLSNNYQVWGGADYLSGVDGYRPGDHGYTLLGESSTTETFSGAYPYYIITVKSHSEALIDTVEGSTGQYYGAAGTGNTLEWENVGGAPDGKPAVVGLRSNGEHAGGFMSIVPWDSPAAITVHVDSVGTLGWTPVPPLLTARDQFTGGVIGGKIYVFGGNGDPDGVNLKSTEMYDPGTGQWSFRADNEHNAGYGVEELSGATMNDKLYVFGAHGGGDPYGVFNFIEEYDPATDTWTSKAPKPTVVGGAPAAVYNGEIYVFGGLYANADGVRQNYDVVEAYNPVTDSWRVVTTMPRVLSMMAVAVVGSKVYLIGGVDAADGTLLSDVIAYDFELDEWTTTGLGSLSSPGLFVYSGAAPVSNGKVYIVGGMTSIDGGWSLTSEADVRASGEVLIYDVTAGTFTHGTSLSQWLQSHAVLPLGNSIYVIGGKTGMAPNSGRTDRVWKATIQ